MKARMLAIGFVAGLGAGLYLAAPQGRPPALTAVPSKPKSAPIARQPSFVERARKAFRAPATAALEQREVHGDAAEFAIKVAEGTQGDAPPPNLVPYEDSGKWGYKSTADGRVVVPAEYDHAWDLSDGLAVIMKDGKYGYLNDAGEVWLAPVYDMVHYFQGGIASIQMDGKFGYIDRGGRVIVEPRFDEVYQFFDGVAIVRSGSKYGYIDQTGTVIHEPTLDFARIFKEGLAAAQINGKYGYLDRGGRWAIDPRYDEVQEFDDGQAKVKADGQAFVIDNRGDVISQIATR